MGGAEKSFRGELSLPGDKSISHRVFILSSLARGTSRVKNLLLSEDVMMTRKMMESLGLEIHGAGREIWLQGKGPESLSEPADVLYAGNSGTTMRIGSGLLAAIDGLSVITGDRYLRRRPMDRIALPLSQMGATVMGRNGGRYPPLVIRGGKLKPIKYEMPTPSAQVKSAILVAAAAGGVAAAVQEPLPTRDHTERMLINMGAKVSREGGWITYEPGDELGPLDMTVPSDFSSAAFFIVGATITSGSEILLKNVLVNPLRDGLLRVLARMGAKVQLINRHVVSGEETADMIVRSSELKGTAVEGNEIPLLVDEVPILAVAAAFASGITEIRGAGELRVKESDRIAAMTSQLAKLGVKIEELPDGMVIEGNRSGFRDGEVSSFGDHRIAMALEIFAQGAGIEARLDDRDCISTSFPDFYEKLKGLFS